jgi:hypothetical protein
VNESECRRPIPGIFQAGEAKLAPGLLRHENLWHFGKFYMVSKEKDELVLHK